MLQELDLDLTRTSQELLDNTTIDAETKREFSRRLTTRMNLFKQEQSEDPIISIATPTHFEEGLYEDNEFASLFDTCSNSPFARQLHNELCATIKETHTMLRDNPWNTHLETTAPVIYYYTALAKSQTNPVVAFHLSDFSYFLMRASEGTVHLTNIVTRGAGKGIMNYTKQWKELIQHPDQIPMHLVDRCLSPIMLAGTALTKAIDAVHLACTDPDEFCERIEQMASNFVLFIQDNPEEAVAMLTEIFLQGKVNNAFKFKNIQPLVNALQSQKELVDLGTTLKTAFNEKMAKIQNLFESALNNPGIAKETHIRKGLQGARRNAQREYEASKGALTAEATVRKSARSLAKEKKLPVKKGKIRFIPSKRDQETQTLTKVQWGKDEGYKDKFGNVWVDGKSRTRGEDFEWDVQLSEQGKRQLGWATRDESHLNVSLKGRITHK